MLETAELQLLSKWCRARSLHWQPGVADDGRPALLLLGTPQQTMMLQPDEDEWRLLDQPGDVLAAASGLTELLDALDAGMGSAVAAPLIEIGLAGPLGDDVVSVFDEAAMGRFEGFADRMALPV